MLTPRAAGSDQLCHGGNGCDSSWHGIATAKVSLKQISALPCGELLSLFLREATSDCTEQIEPDRKSDSETA